jgi:hypothetical protein
VRAGSIRLALVPGAGVGALLLVVALVFGVRTLGAALWLAGATYVGFLAGTHHGVDESAPLVAALLLLCGELSAWSVDERWRIRSDLGLQVRRAAAVAALALGGAAIGALVVALTAAPPSHGLAWTLVGALAAVAVAASGIRLARR